ncbi:hypothetical protein GCM10010425_30750 [Streptomyces spororaveus]|uniref:Uncharacterized protein n=1 Tax=Streptomyces spororaveus TaxID=284039 RepID=A0ABQ3T667_9ACTN|nr:hypothetical protein Sspor_14590 [Streptomyces spororaveus]
MDGRPPHTDPDSDHRLCGICPALRYPREDFIIFDRPCREAPFDPADGHRYTLAREPACVHPHKIGMPPDHTAAPYEPAPSFAPPTLTPRRWWPWGR